MKLIVLSGEDHHGKTTALNLLAEKIHETGLVLKEKIPKGNPREKDFDYVFYRDSECAGRPIIVSTWGDYPDLLRQCCEKYNNAELIVCACNIKFMRGRKYTPFVDALKYDKFATVILKQGEPLQEKHQKANEECADYLFSLIRHFGIL